MVWNRWDRSPSKKPPIKSWSPKEMEMVGFVISKGINIGISPDFKHNLYHWQIDIKIGNGKVHTDPNRYSDKDIYENVIKYYEYYYNKYKLNTNKDG